MQYYLFGRTDIRKFRQAKNEEAVDEGVVQVPVKQEEEEKVESIQGSLGIIEEKQHKIGSSSEEQSGDWEDI